LYRQSHESTWIASRYLVSREILTYRRQPDTSFIYFREMIGQWLNWRTFLAIIAILIVSGTVFYSRYLGQKIAGEERKKVEQWVAAQQNILDPANTNFDLAVKIITENTDIPIIETNDRDSITNFYLLDSGKVAQDRQYLARQLSAFRQLHPPIKVALDTAGKIANYYYYGPSKLQGEVEYYPLVQLLVVSLFILMALLSVRNNYKSMQNQLWAGMAKETAHQMGTPLTSLKGWVEVLREEEAAPAIVPEIAKDVSRLELVSERFAKIGSIPQQEEKDLVQQVQYMIDYMRRRAGGRVSFRLNSNEPEIIGWVSPSLFDWVIENLLKNALDAMDGKGSIQLNIVNERSQVVIDVTDTGKGIPKANFAKVFKPGYSTKKRGWGLGLTLTKRIVEQYHKGKIFVKHSEPGKGTTFRIILPKA
jgi:signal transduction histidine kinase